MASVDVYKKDGKKSGSAKLRPEIFESRINKRLLNAAEKAYAANQRRGTHETKTRKEVRGGGAKPWRQKGTGRARAGSCRSPLWVGGGVIFGPHQRDYSVNLPKNMKDKALISALSGKLSEESILVVEDIELSEAKTKEFHGILKALKLDKTTALIVTKDVTEKLKRASSNLEKKLKVKTAQNVNAYDVGRKNKVLFTKDALAAIEERLTKKDKPKK